MCWRCASGSGVLLRSDLVHTVLRGGPPPGRRVLFLAFFSTNHATPTSAIRPYDHPMTPTKATDSPASTDHHRTTRPGVARQRPIVASADDTSENHTGPSYPVEKVLTADPGTGELLDIDYDWSRSAVGEDLSWFARPDAAAECSGVWQFRDLMPFFRTENDIVSVGEGKTILQRADALGRILGMPADDSGRLVGGLYLQYEGLNPTGSFKDNGMTAAFTHAKLVNAKIVACASTGNTSASMAMYAMAAGMRACVFIGEGKIAYGKLSQALDYGAETLQVAGDFDACLKRVRDIAEDPAAGVYLMNSVNPFRLEGQKAVMLRVLRDLGWRVPDWIIVPGGNLGNCSAFGKAFIELWHLGLIDRVPRLAVVNARGARTLDRLYNQIGVRWSPAEWARDAWATPGLGRRSSRAPLQGSYDRSAVDREYARMDSAGERANTIASAIEINRPVNLSKSLRALAFMDGRGTSAHNSTGGVVLSIDDHCILEHKALVGRHGLGCEPASAASVAGARLLLEQGVIKPDQHVVCILTGHQLKDPDATVRYHTGIDAKAVQHLAPKTIPLGSISNRPVRVADDEQAIRTAMGLG